MSFSNGRAARESEESIKLIELVSICMFASLLVLDHISCKGVQVETDVLVIIKKSANLCKRGASFSKKCKGIDEAGTDISQGGKNSTSEGLILVNTFTKLASFGESTKGIFAMNGVAVCFI